MHQASCDEEFPKLRMITEIHKVIQEDQANKGSSEHLTRLDTLLTPKRASNEHGDTYKGKRNDVC